MAIGESERLSCIEGARSALERTATGLGCGPFCAAAGGKKCCGSNMGPPQGGEKTAAAGGERSREAEKTAAKRKRI